MPGVTCLIAAYDEADRIATTVRAVSSVAGVGRVIVVDDGSRDGTADRAEEAGADVVRLTANVGKGAALEAGAQRVEDDDIVLLIDADLAETATQAASLLSPILAGQADMVVATLPAPASPSGFGLVKQLARWGIRRLAGGSYEPTAPLSGQRALTRRAFLAARPFRGGYGVEVASTIRVMRAGFTIVEVPTTMTHAATDRDIAGFLHRGRQWIAVAATLVRLALEPSSRTP